VLSLDELLEFDRLVLLLELDELLETLLELLDELEEDDMLPSSILKSTS